MCGRKLTPERLDDLPPDAPEALASRRDLRRLNRLMGHSRAWRGWLAREFGRRPPRCLVELGAGDGGMTAENLLGVYPEAAGAMVVFVDRAPCVRPATVEALRRRGWTVSVEGADAFEWLEGTRETDVLCANLFLHHFAGDALERLFKLASRRTRILAALEPRRSPLARAAAGALPLLGAHPVTRHDARVSVEAGFRGRELSALWPDGGEGWMLTEHGQPPFSHWFSARRFR